MKQFHSSEQETIDSIISTIDCIRIEKGFSLSRLALEADVSENTVKYIFKKQTCPTIPTLIRICGALGLPLWEFFLLSSVEKMQPHREYELLVEFDKLDNKYKELVIYIAKYLSE